MDQASGIYQIELGTVRDCGLGQYNANWHVHALIEVSGAWYLTPLLIAGMWSACLERVGLPYQIEPDAQNVQLCHENVRSPVDYLAKHMLKLPVNNLDDGDMRIVINEALKGVPLACLFGRFYGYDYAEGETIPVACLSCGSERVEHLTPSAVNELRVSGNLPGFVFIDLCVSN